MKTKFSRFGRSSVSVILAVMMLLSTMLVGTVSTVNAATGTVTVYFKNTVKWSNVYAYFYNSSYWDASKGSGSSGIAGGPYQMTKVEGTDDIYSYTYTGNYSQYISFTKDRQENYGNFWSTEAVYRDDFNVSKALYTPNTTSSGTYNNSSVKYYNNGTWSKYPEDKPVAGSVSLSAAPASISEGETSTLTATLTNKNSSVGDVAYSFTDASNKEVGKVTTSDSTASVEVTPSSTTTYKVTATATGYTSVDASTTVTVKTVPKAELLYGNNGDPLNSTSSLSMTYDAGTDCFYYVVDSNLYSSNFRFRFSYNSIQYGAAWETYPVSKTVNVDGDKVDVNKDVTGYTNKPGCKVGNATSKFTIWFDANNLKTWIVNAEAPKHTVTYALGTDSADMGSVSAKSADADIESGAQIEEGKSVTFKATANNGYEFVGWYGDAACTGEAVNTNAEYTVSNISADTAVYAKFTEKEYTVSHTQGTGYTISGLPTAKVKYNDTVSFTVTPAEGYKIDSVKANDETLTASDGSYSFTMPANDVTVTVTASLNSHSISNESADLAQATFTVDGKEVSEAKMGDKVTVSAEKTGYTLSSISVVDADGKEVATTGLTFTMPASAVKVTLNFTVNSYDVTVAENANCTVTVGSKKYAYDSAVSFNVEPKAGFNVTEVTAETAKGDKVTVSGSIASGYTFTMPADNVTITVTTEAVDVAAPIVTLNGGAGQTTDNISANQTYPVTAKAEEGDEFSTIKDGAVPTVSCDVENADYDFVKDELTGIYNFNAKTAGTYTITYKATAKSNNSDKENSATATLVITVNYTETQKAYNTLKAYYESVKNPTESDYSAEAYAALTAKLAAVKTLVEAGLPASSDTNTAKYTTAKAELEKAVADKLINLYLTGRFRIYDKNGTEHKIGYNEKATDDNFKFSYVDSGLYSLYTGCTVDKLNETINQDGTAPQYFFIYDTKNVYGISKSPNESTKSSPASLIPRSSVKESARFAADGKTGIVTLWIDTNNASDPSEYKFYYTVEVSPKYAVSGDFGAAWNTYDENHLVNGTTDDPYVFTYVLDNSDSSSSKLFRLIDSSSNEYGPSDATDKNLADYTSKDSALSLSSFTKDSAYGHNLSIPQGKYTLYVDQSGTTPKVWVERIVDTKNVNFTISGEGTGTVSINGTNVGETSVQAVEIGSSYTITLTPSADSYVESFKVGDAEVTSNTYKGTMPNEDVAVTVVFAKKTIHSVLVESDNGGAAEADITTAYSGQKVTVTVNADDNHVFDGISVKEKTSQNTVDCTKNEDGTYTFVMPDDDVNVYAKFREKNTYTVTVVSANQQLGTVSIADTNETTAQVKEGDTVTIKATPIDPNSFDTWTLTGKYAFKGCTSNDAEATVVVNSDVKATASFTETAPYQVAYGSNGTLMRMNKTKYDGIYISTGTIVSSSNDSNPDSHFTIYDTANNKYAVISAKGYYWLKDDNLSKTMEDKDSWKDAYVYGPDKGLINNACSSAKYVVYNANTKTITLTDNPDYGIKATLYVKNGTYSTSFKTGNTKDYAISSVAAGLTATKTDPCNTYSVAFDTNVNVQTTLTDTYRKAGYYVGAYCVNGRNYTASAKDADQGIYQANITITEELAENGVVEVTPVYYNRVIEQNGDYITFYVDADQAVSDWGNTIAVDAYCYVNGVQSNADHLFGTYPGQPMVRDGRYYVINVPRYRYYIDTDGSLVKDTNSPVSGVTLNNYNNESIHGGLVPIKRNMQTYDFSDFVKLANLDGVKTIMFQNQFYNATDSTAKRNMSVVYGVQTDAVPSSAKKTISNIVNANVNPWQDFTDYYGRETDALGNILSDEQKENDCLYIISTGSFNSTAYSTKGEWVTIWNVYDHNGNLVTYGTPADFLDSTTSQYQALNKDAYLGKPVKISYEKGQLYSDANTSRTDGRWYYSKLGQEFTSDVAIEYKYQNDKVYTADTDSNAGNNTGFVGTTTKATATINNVTTASFSSVTETAHLNVKVSNGWRFDGWFIKQGDKYTKVSDNYTDISTDVLMSNSYHIVACISEIPSGTLELNHMAYTGTDPAAHTGTGFYYISAILKKADGSEVEFDETQGVISIDNFAEDDKLTITLRAKCHGDNTVYALYEGEAGGYTEIGPEDKDLRGLSEFTYSFTVPAGSLFKNGKLGVNALNYYTDIVKVGGTCDITYKYYDRFSVEGAGNMVSYVVRNIELSTYEITHGYIPTNETITKYAPRIDTMYVDTKWNLADSSKVELGKSQATVIATQTDKTCDVYYPNKDGEYYTDLMNKKTVAYNTLFKDDNGNFILSAPETDESGKLFTYWEVYRADENGKPTELVTKCYERNFGLRIMADYYIVPVYDGKAPTLTANINAPVLNREIYGDSTSATDKLYVDLLTAFTSTAIPTFKENTTNLTVECGVFVLRNNTTKLSDEDRTTLVTAALAKDDDTTSTILANNYMRSADTETSVVTKLKELAQDSSVKDKSNTLATFDNDQYRITKLIFDNNTLTNKNRIDEVLKFTNNTANQNYIFTAYAFVVIKDSDGTVSEMQISDPQYFNLCYVGNKAL